MTTQPRILVAAGIVLALAACSNSKTDAVSTQKAPTNGVLKLGFLNDIGQPPDPDVFYAGSGLALTTNMYEGLVKYANGAKPRIVPSLATSWTVNKTNTVFTFHLRKGVKFQDGTPFTSAAVKADFQRRLAVDGGPAYMAKGVKSFATPDRYTSVITLRRPNSAFLDELASPYGPRMISPTGLRNHAGKDHAQSYLSTHSLGTGPYELTEAKVDDHYQMKAFRGYWAAEPTFTTIDFTVYHDTSAMQLALNNGDLAAIIGSLPSAAQGRYAEQKKLKVFRLPTFQVGVLQMNPHRRFLATAAARHAMFDAIDWRSIIKQVVPNEDVVATGAYSRGSMPAGSDAVTITHDPSKLAKYIATLPKGTPVNIGYGAGGSDDEQISNIIAAQLQALGVKATVTAYQTSQVFGSFAAHPKKAPDMMVSSKTWPDSNNPYLYGHVFWDPDGGLNHLQCSDKTATADLAKGLRTGSTRAYAAAARAITAAMCTPIWAYASDFVVAQPWLEGVAAAHSTVEPYTLDFNLLRVG